MKLFLGIATGLCRVTGLVLAWLWIIPCCLVALLPCVLLALVLAVVHPIVESVSREAASKFSDILRNEIVERGRDAYQWVMELI